LAAWSPDTDRRNAITVTNVTLGTVTVLPQQYNHLLDGETDPVKVKAAQEYWAGKVGDILVKMKQFENDP
ncbi:hypothetical protein B8W90_14520, partial [Staphylococcus hominis]